MSNKIELPSGQLISYENDRISVPEQTIIPFIEGDGIGRDITPVMKQVVDAAIFKAYGNKRKIHWVEIYAGEKANKLYPGDWLPKETLDLIKKCHVAIKGPLATPVGGGIRSLNVAIRQKLDLFICLRPIRYIYGTPSPLKSPEKTNMVIFRENSEDIYMGIEWKASSKEAKQVIDFLQNTMNVKTIQNPEECGIGIKPVSKKGSDRLIRAAIQYAIKNGRNSVTLVHKGNIMKFTEGAFKDWGYELAVKEFNAQPIEGTSNYKITTADGRQIVIKDVIADAFLQQILLRPEDYSVIATLNLNGDYISDALAAQVGGIGMAPGANIGSKIAVFEATHGTAPKYAGLNKVNPSSLILSAEMMLRHLGWVEAAEKIINGLEKNIEKSFVTYDLARLVKNATELSCSQFGQKLIEHM